MRNYVGVSGVSNHAQQEVIGEIARENGINNGIADLLIGVKATEKTQWLDMPNKYGADWYPVGDAFETAFEKIIDLYDHEATSKVYFMQPAIQMFFGSLASDMGLSKEFTERVLQRSSKWTRYAHDGAEAARVALQLDRFPWMSPRTNEYLEWLIESRLANEIILQCYGDYMQSFHPYEVARRLGQVGEMGLTPLRVLFDASHGTGRQMDPESLRPFIGGVVDSRSSEGVEVVVAGGLCGDNLEKFIPPLIDEFGMLSWDAEGRLHDGNERSGGGFIEKELRKYLAASAEILRVYDIDGFDEDDEPEI